MIMSTSLIRIFICPSCGKEFGVNDATFHDTDFDKYTCIHCGETLPRGMFERKRILNGEQHQKGEEIT